MTWHPDIPEEYRNQIMTGDARELTKRIPDESIDLIFTDPVYDRIEDYEWLAREASRVLKSDSSLLIFCGIGYLPETIIALEKSNLDYRWTIGGKFQSAYSYQFIGKLIPKYIMALWYQKGNAKMYKTAFDMDLLSMNKGIGSNNDHKWGKHISLISRWINTLSITNSIIFDPFCGNASIPSFCKILGRNYIAFEIDPNTAELARERVRNTQPPLFVLEPEQQELDI